MISLLLLVLAGFFLGGVISFWRGGNKPIAVVLALFVALTCAAAYFWAQQ